VCKKNGNEGSQDKSSEPTFFPEPETAYIPDPVEKGSRDVPLPGFDDFGQPPRMPKRIK
jgi:hypothetical protein